MKGFEAVKSTEGNDGTAYVYIGAGIALIALVAFVVRERERGKKKKRR